MHDHTVANPGTVLAARSSDTGAVTGRRSPAVAVDVRTPDELDSTHVRGPS
jgi:rhodanese-related sulfurtransferase